MLQGALPGTSDTPQVRSPAHAKEVAPRDPRRRGDDDATSRAHRLLIGFIGLSIPTLLPLLAWLRPNDRTQRSELLGSISSYYYTSGVVAFVGLLIALALYLLAYQGFRNRHQREDKIAAKVAAVAAIGVAAFPTNPPASLQPPWWSPKMADVHYGSAFVLFAAFAYFCLRLFRLTDPARQPQKDKAWRNTVYLICGLAIVGGIIWSFVAGYVLKGPIFWPETFVLIAFATAWLVKGSIHKVIREAITKLSAK